MTWNMTDIVSADYAPAMTFLSTVNVVNLGLIKNTRLSDSKTRLDLIDI